MADVNQIKLPNGNTYNLTDTLGRKEAYLEWGGKNFTGSYGCIDAAMVSDLNANRFSFLKKAGITIEYTRNGGTTWTDYAATEQSTVGLFNPGNSFSIGKADSTNKATANGTNYQLRVTINAASASIYTYITKVIIYCSTNGSNDCKCQIFGTLKPSTDYTKITDPVAISGWSGYNVIQTGFTIGNSFNGQYNNVRFLFTANGGNTTYTGLTILQILGFGGVGWTTPSTMAKLGHLYSYDGLQNATFPAQVSATKFNGTATNADKVNNLTVQTAVPANAVFTDTKVTTSANHYTPATATGSDISASASGGTASWSIDVVQGVTLNTDSKGHVTGMSVTSGKIPANPNSDIKVRQSLSTTNKNYPLLMSYAESSSTTANIDNVSYRANTIYANPSTGNIQATQLNGVAIGSSPKFTDTDTKNTAGATNTTSKMYLIGALSQDTNSQTYSNSDVYCHSGIINANGFTAKYSNDSVTIDGNGLVKCCNANDVPMSYISSGSDYYGGRMVLKDPTGTFDAVSLSGRDGLVCKSDNNTTKIQLSCATGNINCTTINGHNIPTTLSESVTYSFNATTTLSYIGKSITCSTGTKIVRAYFRYVHSAPVETAVVRSSTSLGSYYCDVIAYGKDASSPCLTFIIKAGETFYFWAKYSGNAQNNLDVHSVYIQDN